MTPEQLDQLGKIFRFAHEAEVAFESSIELRFSADGESGTIMVIDKDEYDSQPYDFHSLEQAKQILLDMFSM